jgi:MFS transporter, DHA2 family, multidrug resistance protein
MSTNIQPIDSQRVTQPRAGRWWALSALVVSGLVIGLDSTVLITALPTLSAKLGASTADLQWIAAAYTLALGGLLLPGGVLGDRFGRKRLLLVGLALFGVASIAASQVSTAGSLIAMRALMGVGAALILPLSLSILPSMFAEEERPRAVSAAAAGAFLGLPLGPLLAGWLLTHYAWGSVFLINAPVVVLALLGVWFLVPESKDPHPRAFDWVGMILAVLGVTALVYGVIEQPIHGWTDGTVLAAVFGGAAVLVAFVAWDLRHPSPFVDLRNFRNRSFTWATMAFVITGFALFGVMFILTPYIQIVLGNDAQATGVKLIPLIGGVLVGAVGGNVLATRLGVRLSVGAGLLVTAAGLVAFSRVGADTGYGLVGISLAVSGFGLGIALPTTLDIILGTLPPEQTGAGSALTRALQQIAASFGVAILGSILSNVYQNNLASHLAGMPAGLRGAAQGSIAAAHAIAAHLPAAAGGPLIQAANNAYIDGLSTVMLVSAALVIVAAVLIAIFLPSRTAKIEAGDLA